MWNDELVIIELKCCCCGKVLDTLTTHWKLRDVRAESVWTQQPCRPCELELSPQPASVYDPRD
jgi:hypothetical protein